MLRGHTWPPQGLSLQPVEVWPLTLQASVQCLWAPHVCTCQDQPFPTDFPDSRPAVEDLKYCLERTDQRSQLLVSLKAALETRLPHPGR